MFKFVYKKYIHALILLFIALVINIFFQSLSGIIVVLIFITINIITILVIHYRIKKGYYGTNEEECREIIRNIINKK